MSASEERALLELNLRRETWCQVELNPRQSWERTERRHYRSHLQTSAVLITALTGGPQRRAARCKERPPPAKLPERRHFEESCRKACLEFTLKRVPISKVLQWGSFSFRYWPPSSELLKLVCNVQSIILCSIHDRNQRHGVFVFFLIAGN